MGLLETYNARSILRTAAIPQKKIEHGSDLLTLARNNLGVLLVIRPLKFVAAAALTSLACAAALAAAPDFVPDPGRTPGALNPEITQENFHEKVCVEHTKQYRPPNSYRIWIKQKQLRELGYGDQNFSDYEEDHLVPLSLGGDPKDPRNLWPEPRLGEWGAQRKDELEFALYKAACRGEISLAEARAAFTPNWTQSYARYAGLIQKYQYKPRAGSDD
jgi:hypothetical protein